MKAIKKKYLGLLLALFVLLVVGSTDTLASDKEKKITICHKTSSGTNPWVTIEIDESAWDSHEEHGDYKGPCRCNNSLEIYLVENEVDLGDFFPGSTHDLPAESGGNNQLEFVVTGSGNTGNKGHHADDDNMATYDFDYTMDL
ncbi:MAG: hypothetical protein PF588_09160 [Candidatus Kapabacteria bacterium]|jgi:hypothetical protein|nr:hypothetical protein [Candidatus Kapabacteria bacterium]